MMYMVMYNCTHHIPEIRYDTYDIMSRVTAVGNKPTMITLPAHSSHTVAVRVL